VKYLLLSILFLLTACSSSSGRAPVYDVKSNKNTPYVAKGKAIKPGQLNYTVHKGDTLYSIAWRAKMNVNTLIARNNLKKPYIIKEGQVLQLRKKSTKSTSQKVKKQTASTCTAQSCQKKTTKKIEKKSTTSYSKSVAKKNSKNAVQKSSKNIAQESSLKTQPSKKQPVEKKAPVWRWPSKGRLIKSFASSTQGMKGISISNSRGTPVYAAAAGQVVYAGNGLRGYGNLVIIKHNYEYLSAYAHNEKLLVKENDQIKLGQKIAEMGDSGTDSVYLHFDIRYRGKSVDPLRYLPKR